jgi:hypothetical protein
MNRLAVGTAGAALALIAVGAPLGAQATTSFDHRNHEINKHGMAIALVVQVEIDWTPVRAGDFFGHRPIGVKLTGLRATARPTIIVDDEAYDAGDFDGALRGYFDQIAVVDVSMGVTLTGVRQCNRHSRSYWRVGDVEKDFCNVENPPLKVQEWFISDATFTGIDELRNRVRVLKREREAAKERALKAEEARVDSLARRAVDTGDSAAIRRDPKVAARAARIKRDREFKAYQVSAISAQMQRYERLCQRADAAYRAGNTALSVQLYGELRAARNSGFLSRECARVADSRYMDGVMTTFANGYTSLLSAVADAFGVSTGPVAASFPLPKDEFGGGAFGMEIGKGIYYADLMMGNHVWGPALEALANPGPPDLSNIGCYGPTGNDFFGAPCSNYYADPEAAPRRYRVKFALGAGIISPKGMGWIYPTASLNYVYTDDGNLIVPSFGIVISQRRRHNARWGYVYGGDGIRLGVTRHQGKTGWQAGLAFSK